MKHECYEALPSKLRSHNFKDNYKADSAHSQQGKIIN